MEAIKVRLARPGELDAAFEVILDGYREFGAHVTPEFHWDFRQDVATVVNDSRTEVLVAEVEGKLGGAITFYPNGPDYNEKVPDDWACLRTLAVLPEQRGRGVGRALMLDAIRRARMLGRSRVLLHTLPFMKSAIRLHENLGFQREFQLDAEYEGVTAIAYVLELSG